MSKATEAAAKVRDKVMGERGVEIPADVKDRLKRGRERLEGLRPKREEAVSFTHNEHYVNVSEDGKSLQSLSMVSVVQYGKKPDHRVRRSHDLISPIVKGKVAAASQRVPGYEILTNSTDPEDYSAARIA